VKHLDSVLKLAEAERSEWALRFCEVLFSGDPIGLKTNAGNDLQAAVMGGDLVGETGTATASSATSLTTNSGRTAVSNDLAGHIVVADGTPFVLGVITANTSGTNTVLTVDKWTVIATPASTGTTPSATAKYAILPGGHPAFWMAITTTVITPAAGDTTLSGELTSPSGLARRIATYSHTTGANTYALAATFTNGDATSRTINTMAVFNLGPGTGGRMLFESQVPNPPVLASATDTVTITDTVTM
jgi:hypothetical protein